MSDDTKLVLLAKTLSPGSAHIIRGALESSDIPCFVFDDNHSSLGVGIGIINTRIMVPETFLNKAQELLQKLENEYNGLKDDISR